MVVRAEMPRLEPSEDPLTPQGGRVRGDEQIRHTDSNRKEKGKKIPHLRCAHMAIRWYSSDGAILLASGQKMMLLSLGMSIFLCPRDTSLIVWGLLGWVVWVWFVGFWVGLFVGCFFPSRIFIQNTKCHIKNRFEPHIAQFWSQPNPK